MTHFCPSIGSKMIPSLLHDFEICRAPPICAPRVDMMETLQWFWRFLHFFMSEASKGYADFPHHLSLQTACEMITTKGQTTSHNQWCKCYTYTAQLLAKMAPAKAMSCFKKEKSWIDVKFFLETRHSWMLIGRKKGLFYTDTLHVTTTLLSLRDPTAHGCDNRTARQSDWRLNGPRKKTTLNFDREFVWPRRLWLWPY